MTNANYRKHKQSILVAYSGQTDYALGNIWRMTSSNNNFYLDIPGNPTLESFHISCHGRNAEHEGHRFHIKIGRDIRELQNCATNIPRKGQPFPGKEIAKDIFLIARIRWDWNLRRERFSETWGKTRIPPEQQNESRFRSAGSSKANSCLDIDIVVSFKKCPFWQMEDSSFMEEKHYPSSNNAQLGPLKSTGDLFLTATSHSRSPILVPTPKEVLLPLPSGGEKPTHYMGTHIDQKDGFLWIYESIAAQETISNLKGTKYVA